MPAMLPLGAIFLHWGQRAMTHIYMHLSHMNMIFFKFSVLIQATKENQILYTNNFQMKNHVKTHRNLTKITKEFYQIQSW